MSPQHYSYAKLVSLSDYIDVERFRTVMNDDRKVPCGISEIPVEIEVKEAFAKTLPFFVPWDGMIVGFAIRMGKTKELIDGFVKDERILKIYLQDWDNKFLLVIESSLREYAYYVETQEVRSLLVDCMKPEEQR